MTESDIFLTGLVTGSVGLFLMQGGWLLLRDKQAAWEKRIVKKLRKKTDVISD